MDKNTINISIIIQIISAGICTLALYVYLNNIHPIHKILTSILGLVTLTQVIHVIFYMFIFKKLSTMGITNTSYFNMFITIPLILLASVVYYKYEEYVENFKRDKVVLEKMTLFSFIDENRGILTRIVIYSLLMILFSYLGEIGVINKTTGFLLGFFFLILAFIDMYEFAKKSKKGFTVYISLFLLFTMYNFSYLFNPTIKNIIFNILDVVIINLFGLYLVSKIMMIKPTK